MITDMYAMTLSLVVQTIDQIVPLDLQCIFLLIGFFLVWIHLLSLQLYLTFVDSFKRLFLWIFTELDGYVMLQLDFVEFCVLTFDKINFSISFVSLAYSFIQVVAWFSMINWVLIYLFIVWVFRRILFEEEGEWNATCKVDSLFCPGAPTGMARTIRCRARTEGVGWSQAYRDCWIHWFHWNSGIKPLNPVKHQIYKFLIFSPLCL